MKKIGILGSGIVAKTLGSGFIKHGYQVMLGTRDAAKLADWKKESGGEVGSFSDAAQFGELVVLAAKGTVAGDVLQQAGAAHLKNKTVIDATNPIAELPPVNGVLQFFTTLEDSLMERFQKQYPDVHFVKAFNSIGSAFMVNPSFESKPSMFICGNDDAAKTQVKSILDQFGFETEDMGKVEAARAIEPLCMLWCIPGFLSNQWSHAFRLMKK